MPFLASEILENLDKGAESFDFPVLDNTYYYLGKEKLVTFRSNDEWLMVFQEISFSIRAASVENVVSAFGSHLDKNGIILISWIIQEDRTKMYDDDNNFLLKTMDFKVVINGTERHFNPTSNDYRQLGIDLADDKTPDEAKITRYLASAIPDELFFDNERLLEICKRSDGNLEVFLELEDWYHPDLINEEKPSETRCFQTLAEALAGNDKSLYQCPAEDYNTHWSNWEWYKEE